MNNPNPFVPKGSLLEQQSQRRSRLKLGVSCVLGVSVTCLVAMLTLPGCKREQPATDSDVAAMDTNPPTMTDTNPPVTDTNPPIAVPPMATNPPVVVPPVVVETAGTEYIVVAGDTLGKIAKAHNVSLKALEDANPGVDPKKLKIKQKLTIPASAKSADVTSTATMGGTDADGETYTVKSGDTLTRIAKAHGTNVKAIEAANNLTTTKIKVGQKLKIPAKAEAPATTAPAMDTTSAPVVMPNTSSAPAATAPPK